MDGWWWYVGVSSSCFFLLGIVSYNDNCECLVMLSFSSFRDPRSIEETSQNSFLQARLLPLLSL